MRNLGLSLLLLVVTVVPASAEIKSGSDLQATPFGAAWTVQACSSWNIAASALVEGNGSRSIVALPTVADDYPWIVLRRVEGGSFHIPDDIPFELEMFDSLPIAVSRYSAMDSSRKPMLITMTDGKILVVSLKAPPRRRATGR